MTKEEYERKMMSPDRDNWAQLTWTHKRILQAIEEKRLAKEKQEKSHSSCMSDVGVKDKKGKSSKKSKKCNMPDDHISEIHLLELREASECCAEKAKIHMKELELEVEKQAFEKERHKAKMCKMELDAK